MPYDKPRTFFASTLTEVLNHLKNIPNLQVLSGCTLCKQHLNNSKIQLPPSCIFVSNIAELQEIHRTERFIDFGSAVTLNQILDLGKTRVPTFFYNAVLSIASHNIGNIASLGGNICNVEHKMSLYSPLLAMDAILELKSFSEIRHVAMSKFTEIPKGFLLTKIRMPISDWHTALFFRLGPTSEMNEQSASFTFLADTSKGALEDLRIAFCGALTLRSQELEDILIGSRLPLSEKDIVFALDKASQLYDAELEKLTITCTSLLKDQFLNLLQYSLSMLT